MCHSVKVPSSGYNNLNCRSFTAENTLYGIENFEDSLEGFGDGTDPMEDIFDSVQSIISL